MNIEFVTNTNLFHVSGTTFLHLEHMYCMFTLNGSYQLSQMMIIQIISINNKKNKLGKGSKKKLKKIMENSIKGPDISFLIQFCKVMRQISFCFFRILNKLTFSAADVNAVNFKNSRDNQFRRNFLTIS